VNKKLIIIGSAAGLVTFAVAFFGMRMLGKSDNQVPAQEMPQPKTEDAKSAEKEGQTKQEAQTEETQGLTQKQLKSLAYELREKINEYDNKVKELDLREARVQMTQETLKKDIETLNQLRVETATMVANFKEQRNQLLESRAAINRNEKANFTTIAATYDKMDPAGASKIIISMCAKQMEAGKIEGSNMDDAVKILFYMTERGKAKVLAELASTEPKLAAVLCQRLKKVVEQD